MTSIASLSARSGQKPGQPFGQHGLPGPRRARQQQVVGAGGGDFKGFPRVSPGRQHRTCPVPAPARPDHQRKSPHHPAQSPGQVPADPPRSRHASRARVRYPRTLAPGTRPASAALAWATTTSGIAGLNSRHHRREDAPDRPQPAVQAQLGNEDRPPVDLMSFAARRTAMVMARSKPEPRFGSDAGMRLAVIFRRLSGIPEFWAAERIRSLASFSEASGKTEDDERRKGLADVGLDLHDVAVEAHEGHRVGAAETHLSHPFEVLHARLADAVVEDGNHVDAPRTACGVRGPGTTPTPAGEGGPVWQRRRLQKDARSRGIPRFSLRR